MSTANKTKSEGGREGESLHLQCRRFITESTLTFLRHRTEGGRRPHVPRMPKAPHSYADGRTDRRIMPFCTPFLEHLQGALMVVHETVELQ